MSEIVRAGIISVDEGQHDASQALGMTRLQTMRRIVLPQAMRVIIPPTGNETISMLKTSSLVFVIAVTDLLYSSQLIYSVNYKIFQLLFVASIWYLLVTSILTIGQYYLERYVGRGSTRAVSLTPFQRFRQSFWPRHDELAMRPDEPAPFSDSEGGPPPGEHR
jgi:polar amino acid transport system permease protein